MRVSNELKKQGILVSPGGMSCRPQAAGKSGL
jgi:hypothetical protein